MEAGALVLGTAQPILLRQYVDTQFGAVIPQLGVYGTPSFLIGAVAGGIATVAAVASLVWNKGIRDPVLAKTLLAYGVPALTGSALIAFFTQTVSSTSQSVPQARFAPQANKATGVAAGSTVAPVAQVVTPVQRNYQSLTPAQKVAMAIR